MGKVYNQHGTEMEFNQAVNYMDQEIREKVHRDYAPCEESTFFSAYEKYHEIYLGEEWELSKKNPVW